MSFGNLKDGVIHLYETTDKTIVLFIVLDNGETQASVPNGISHFSNSFCS